MSAQDLELVDTDDLIQELFSRFDSVVFAGIKEMQDTRRAEEIQWSGDFLKRMGSLEMAKHVMMKQYMEDDTDGES